MINLHHWIKMQIIIPNIMAGAAHNRHHLQEPIICFLKLPYLLRQALPLLTTDPTINHKYIIYIIYIYEYQL